MNRIPALVCACIMLGIATASVSADLVTRDIDYTHGEVKLRGYLAYDGSLEGRRPAVLVVHEWWGLNDYAKRRARELAKLGYVAFALDMYGAGVVTQDTGEAGRLAGAIRGDRALYRARAAAGLNVLRQQPNVDPDRVAAIGYCFGGTTVLELAFSGGKLAGVVSFHGSLTLPDPQRDTDIHAAVLVLHGADDALVPDRSVQAFIEAMRRHGTDWQFVHYGSAVHSFTNPDADKVNIPSVGYDARADRRSWVHMRAFFDDVFSPSAEAKEEASDKADGA